MLQLLRPAWRELAPQQCADLAGLGVQHLSQHLCVVSLPGQARFQVIDVFRQNAGYDLNVCFSKPF
jgi:hypothetical protein